MKDEFVLLHELDLKPFHRPIDATTSMQFLFTMCTKPSVIICIVVGI